MVMMTHYGAGNNIRKRDLSQKTVIEVVEGDNIVLDGEAELVTMLFRKGGDLHLEFTDSGMLELHHFFSSEDPRRESVITFRNNLFTMTEIANCFKSDNDSIPITDLLNSEKHLLEPILRSTGKMTGSTTLSASETTPFSYQFRLDDDIPENATVKVLLNGKSMPSWMQIKPVGSKRYLITAVPGHKEVGQFNLEIVVEI